MNVGAGTITCNYDGVAKHQTVIEDGAFIGSDTQLIAPVRVGKGAYVAAGSSITDDVPAGVACDRAREADEQGRAGSRGTRRSATDRDPRNETHVRNHRIHRPKQVLPILIDGLRRLEYRGYDSAGVAVRA